MITRALQDLRERLRLPCGFLAAYFVFVVLLFAMFYPGLSGVPVNVAYKDTPLLWLPSWIL